jgi:aminopeptidase-like protein
VDGLERSNARVDDWWELADPGSAGRSMHDLIRELYPICRSITGDGVRETLAIVGREIPLDVTEVPSGTEVLDWRVPREWNIRDAWIKDRAGNRVVDFRECNLHVVSYSVPIHATMSRADLEPHLHSIPDHPDWVPYRTSYYNESWGFCVSENQRKSLLDDEYEVCIDSDLRDGHLTYGECVVPGTSGREVLISSHVCHPSLCNDNLAGIAIAAHLARQLQDVDLRYTYRFVFAPGTIGAITWLARNPEAAARIDHGLVLTCVGDPGRFTYKRSRRGAAPIDRAAAYVLERLGPGNTLVDFHPYGYDERQYCSPGFNLGVGCLMRSHHGQFPEYHTSADDLDFVRPDALAGTLDACLRIMDVLEHDVRFRNLSPYGEPMLGRRGLYRSIGGEAGAKTNELALLWVLNQSDGEHSLLDIAERSGLEFSIIRGAAAALVEHDLLEPVL